MDNEDFKFIRIKVGVAAAKMYLEELKKVRELIDSEKVILQILTG